jgi:diguanylate cyclase (GGDEF)-like protein
MNALISKLFDTDSLSNIDKNTLDNIILLHDQLNSLSSSQEYYQMLFNWLNRIFKVHTFKINTFNSNKNLNHIVFHKGKEFNENNNDKLIAQSFTIFSYETAQIFIEADNEEHMQILKEQNTLINFLFYLIIPSLRAAIIQQKYEDVKIIDHLTQLHNRNYLMEHLKHLLPLAQREQQKVAFLMVGVDHFKAVIDEFDYDIGDKVLIELAKVLEKYVRTSDLVARLDSDEFLIVLTNIHSSDDAILVAKKLIDSFAKCKVNVNKYTNQVLKKTICVGSTIYPDDSTSVDQLLKYADIALYEARNKGRSQALAYTKEEESSIDLF